MNRRIALYGGVFDPVHKGHLAVIEQILSELHPDQVILIPCGSPPHKKGRRISDGVCRAEMLCLATEMLPNVSVSDYELTKADTSYTVHTLEYFRKKFGSEAELIWVIGADNFQTFFSWYQPERILQLAKMAVLARPGFDRLEAEKVFPGCYLIGTRQVDISSTEIRERMKNGLSVTEFVPKEVEDYMKRNSLYPPAITVAEAEQLVQSRLTDSRSGHTLRVRDEAVRLAERFGADSGKAELAALMHDVTKQVSMSEQRELCARYSIKTDAMQENDSALLHAVTAEAVSFYQFGIDDNEILSAIRYHTTGCAQMSLLMKIIYLADCIEPGRINYPGLSQIRSLACEHLDQAVLLAMECSVRYLKETGKPIHPDTLEAMEDLKGEIQ